MFLLINVIIIHHNVGTSLVLQLQFPVHVKTWRETKQSIFWHFLMFDYRFMLNWNKYIDLKKSCIYFGISIQESGRTSCLMKVVRTSKNSKQKVEKKCFDFRITQRFIRRGMTHFRLNHNFTCILIHTWYEHDFFSM